MAGYADRTLVATQLIEQSDKPVGARGIEAFANRVERGFAAIRESSSQEHARRDGAFRRFRIVHRPFGGLYTPDLWPMGRGVYETFWIQLPTDLSEKRYSLQFRLVHEPLIPNFSIRDFFFNDDSSVGAACSEIEIRRQLTR